MCPVCIANLALIAAGSTSTGGMAALVVKKVRAKGRNQTDQNGEQNETRTNGKQNSNEPNESSANRAGS
jgi:hypothetical protein